MASRIAARSTTQGTPVKSWSRTRAGRYWISAPVTGFFCQSAIACASAVETVKPPSSKRSMFSSRSEEHTSELQSLMRISYAVFCLKKKKNKQYHDTHTPHTNKNTQN